MSFINIPYMSNRQLKQPFSILSGRSNGNALMSCFRQVSSPPITAHVFMNWLLCCWCIKINKMRHANYLALRVIFILPIYHSWHLTPCYWHRQATAIERQRYGITMKLHHLFPFQKDRLMALPIIAAPLLNIVNHSQAGWRIYPEATGRLALMR